MEKIQPTKKQVIKDLWENQKPLCICLILVLIFTILNVLNIVK